MEHHGGSLRNIIGEDSLAESIIRNYRKADIDSRTLKILEFSEMLTKSPGQMDENNVTALLAEGMTDEEILDLVQLVAYFNYTNRVATALGVDPENSH